MKYMTSLYLVLILFFSQIAFAEPGFHGNREHQQFMRMLHHLDLTQQQKTEIHSLLKSVKPQMKSLMIEMSDAKSQLDAALDNDVVDQAKVQKYAGMMSGIMRDIILKKAQVFAQIRAVWTPQQKEKFTELRIKKEKIRAIMLEDEEPELDHP